MLEQYYLVFDIDNTSGIVYCSSDIQNIMYGKSYSSGGNYNETKTSNI